MSEQVPETTTESKKFNFKKIAAYTAGTALAVAVVVVAVKLKKNPTELVEALPLKA